MYPSYTPNSPFASCARATFQDVVLSDVIFGTRMRSCPPALRTSGRCHLPPLHPKSIEIKVFRATEGFTQTSLSSLVHCIRRAVDYCRQTMQNTLHPSHARSHTVAFGCDGTAHPARYVGCGFFTLQASCSVAQARPLFTWVHLVYRVYM